MDSKSPPQSLYTHVFTAAPEHLYTGKFLDGRIVLLGQYLSSLEYSIAYRITTLGSIASMDGTVQLLLSNFCDAKALVTAALSTIEDIYVSAIAEELAEEVKNGRLPN